jgi:hypothetical protein
MRKCEEQEPVFIYKKVGMSTHVYSLPFFRFKELSKQFMEKNGKEENAKLSEEERKELIDFLGRFGKFEKIIEPTLEDLEKIPTEMMSEEELSLYRTLSRKKKLKGMTLEDLERMRLQKDVM